MLLSTFGKKLFAGSKPSFLRHLSRDSYEGAQLSLARFAFSSSATCNSNFNAFATSHQEEQAQFSSHVGNSTENAFSNQNAYEALNELRNIHERMTIRFKKDSV